MTWPLVESLGQPIMEQVVDHLFPSAYHLNFDRQHHSQHHPHHQNHPNTPYQHPIYYSNLPSRNSSPRPSSPQTRSPDDLYIHSIPTSELDRPSTVDQIHDDAPIDEEPLYVNAKQYFRILKRRVARARLEEVHRLSRQRKVRPPSLYSYFYLNFI